MKNEWFATGKRMKKKLPFLKPKSIINQSQRGAKSRVGKNFTTY